jgi:AcrR family transcriptional regulator
MAPPPADRDDGGASANPGGRITRDVVLAAALELIDRDGVDGLSMRRLARVLGRDPMILYRHAPNKAALLDGVAETVLAQLKVDPADPDWAAQLRAVARGYRALALAHPKVVPLLVTRPLATPLGLRPPGTLRPLEDILALLTRAGFSGPDALHIYRALFGFLHGHVLDELQELIENPDETDDLLRLGLHRLPIREFPLLRSLAPALASYDGAAELERGLDILLTGLTDSLTPRPAAQPGPGAVAAARKMAPHQDPEGRLQDLSSAAPSARRSRARFFAEIRVLGWSSPSTRRLRSRVSWSRSRAACTSPNSCRSMRANWRRPGC